MPPSDAILSGLTAVANEWRLLAVVWHVYLAAAAVALLLGWRPSTRLVAASLVAPVASVSALAWASQNPFNGVAFAALAFGLGATARHLSSEPVRSTSSLLSVPGALLVAFGWTYPHFLRADSWVEYTYAAPFGLVPCPTLSVLVGATLTLDVLRSRAWTWTLIVAGVFYGAVGVFRLDVVLDYGLLTGAALLAVAELSVIRGRRQPLASSRVHHVV